MKKVLNIYLLLLFGLAIAACGETDYLKYDTSQKKQCFFRDDSVRFIFGLLPDQEIDLQIPVDLFGLVDTEKELPFSVSIDKEHSTAIEGNHFQLSKENYFRKDSAAGWIDIDLLKASLEKGKEYILTLELTENTHFSPALKKRCIVYFGDQEIPSPIWWTPSKVGSYNQEKYILLVRYFHQSEKENPAIFQAIVDVHGVNLDKGTNNSLNIELLSDFRYESFFIKYVFSPMYDDYVASGNEMYQIPNPNL